MKINPFKLLVYIIAMAAYGVIGYELASHIETLEPAVGLIAGALVGMRLMR